MLKRVRQAEPPRAVERSIRDLLHAARIHELGAGHLPHLPKSKDDGRHDRRSLAKKFNRGFDVLVEIGGSRRAAHDGMHLRVVRPKPQRPELHRRQRSGGSRQGLGRLVELAALVERADDEDAHVPLVRGSNGRQVPVRLGRRVGSRGHVAADPVVVEIHVIELVGLDRAEDERGRRMRGEAQEADLPFLLQLSRHFQTAARAQHLLQLLLVVDAVEGKQVQVARVQTRQASQDAGLETLRIRRRRRLCLQNVGVSRPLAQCSAEVVLRVAVHLRGLNVVHSQLQRALHDPRCPLRRLEPAVGVEAHASQAEDRHLKLRAPEASSRDLAVCRSVMLVAMLRQRQGRHPRMSPASSTETGGKEENSVPLIS
eukprot:scaffold1992_cov250-Pinguiococcus_pyrenoidosus.AAC.1